MAEQPLGEILLGESTKLIFSVNEWNGRQFASVRKYVATQRYKGWTKSGLLMDQRLLHEVTAGLARLEQSIPSCEIDEFERLQKNDTEYIKIATLPSETPDGLPAVDVREFVDSPAYQGPTKRGFRFRWDLLPGVIACLREQTKVMKEAAKGMPTLFGGEQFSEPEQQADKKNEVQNQSGLMAILGEELKEFPGAFLDGLALMGKRLQLPEDPLRLEQESTGAWVLKIDERVFAKVRNPVEGNFILYAQLRGQVEINLPSEMINIFKTVKSYENYVRSLQIRLVANLTKRTKQRSVAQYEARKKCQECGIPWFLD